MHQLDRADFENLLAFRTGLRRFLHWSQTQAQAAGLTPAQHQLLVAIKGHPGGQPPTVGDLAGYLLLRHHSAVDLVDRGAASFGCAGGARLFVEFGVGRRVGVAPGFDAATLRQLIGVLEQG